MVTVVVGMVRIYSPVSVALGLPFILIVILIVVIVILIVVLVVVVGSSFIRVLSIPDMVSREGGVGVRLVGEFPRNAEAWIVNQ